jgi:two-component system, NarL family, nitrate/nitrite response regulator NarL
MAQFASDSNDSSETGQMRSRWGQSKVGNTERVVEITQLPQTSTRVLIVDGDSMSSDLLANALSREERFEGAAIPASDLLRVLAATDVDLVVIAVDANSNPAKSFDLANEVCRNYRNTYVIMLLNQMTHELVINSFRSGARGVFSRQLAMSEFFDCLRHVAKGLIWAGKRETTALLEAFKSIPAPNVLFATEGPELTVRELQVVQCASKGMTNKAIASELRLSEHTVKNYLFRAFDKLGVSNRVELLFYLTMRGHTFSAKDESPDAGLSIE